MDATLKRFAAALLTTVSLCFSSGALAEPLKVGFVYVGPIGPAGWTYAHDSGRKYVAEKLGDRVKTAYVENVAEGADSERVIRQLAKSGYGLIFAVSFGYMNPTLKVARDFPNVAFEHVSGYKRAKNVGTYFNRIYEARYLTGIVAGKMTKSNVVGYVASFPIPEVIRGINAFTLGIRSVNPEARVKVTWVSSWYDPGKEREAAEALFAQGADVITQHTDSPGPINAAEANGKYAIGFNSDMSVYGKTAHLTAAIQNWAPMYLQKTQAVLDGTWKSEDIWNSMADGMVDIAPMNKAVPAEVVTLVNSNKQAIIDGTLLPFAGPIKNRNGELKVAKGESMSDADLLRFNWFVEGVEGQLPN